MTATIQLKIMHVCAEHANRASDLGLAEVLVFLVKMDILVVPL